VYIKQLFLSLQLISAGYRELKNEFFSFPRSQSAIVRLIVHFKTEQPYLIYRALRLGSVQKT